MANKSNKIKYNLKNVHVAKLTIKADGTFEYATPRHIPGAVSLTLDAEGDNTPFYADGIVYFRTISNNGYTGSLEMALIPDWFREEYLQEIKDANGVLVENADLTDQVYFAVSSQTKEASITPVTETLNLTADARSDGLVKSKTGEDTNAETYNNWYNSVYVPVNSGSGDEEDEGEDTPAAETAAKLSALSIGSLTLSPEFDPDVTSYTATTTNATNTISATGDDGADVAITVNGSEHSSGSAATWETGENTVTIVVSGTGLTSRTYTITVTKGE